MIELPTLATEEIMIILIVGGGMIALGAFLEWWQHRRLQ